MKKSSRVSEQNERKKKGKSVATAQLLVHLVGHLPEDIPEELHTHTHTHTEREREERVIQLGRRTRRGPSINQSVTSRQPRGSLLPHPLPPDPPGPPRTPPPGPPFQQK